MKKHDAIWAAMTDAPDASGALGVCAFPALTLPPIRTTAATAWPTNALLRQYHTMTGEFEKILDELHAEEREQAKRKSVSGSSTRAEERREGKEGVSTGRTRG